MFRHHPFNRLHLLSNGTIIFLAGFIANLFHYLFHLLCGRLLAPILYGELETIISLNVFFGLLLPTFTLIIVNSTAKIKITNYYQLFFHHFYHFKNYILALWLLSLIFYLPISNFLHLNSPLAYLLFSFQVITSSIITICLASFQSQTKFVPYSILLITQPISKLILAALLLNSGWGIIGALASFLISDIITVFLSFQLFKYSSSTTTSNPSISYPSIDFSLYCFIANLGLTLIPITDIFIVRSFLSSQDSSHFSAVSILGKVILFVTGSIITVTYPILVQNQKTPQATKTLFASIVSVSLIGLIALYFYSLLSLSVISFVYGNFYTPAASLMTIYVSYIILFSFVNLITNYYLSQNSLLAAWSSISILVIQLIATTVFHSSLYQIISISALSLFFGVIPFMLYPFLIDETKN